VSATAGSSKTTCLYEAAKRANPSSAIYLSYNKAMAEEAKVKFQGTKVVCSTLHSLAYQAIVPSYQLRIGTFNYRSIKEKLSYPLKVELVNTLNDYLTSAELDIDRFLASKSASIKALVPIYLDKMTKGDISCTHNFYLKLYYAVLASGDYQPPEVDLLMVDEFGDINPVTLEVFKLYPAKKKVAVGDQSQNIYSFNNTVNGFDYFDEQPLQLTRSFRVSTAIAKRIQAFMHKYYDKSFVMEGSDLLTPEFNTTAYISRTNSGLVKQMLKLMHANTPFNLTRTPMSILELPLLLLNMDDPSFRAPPQYSILNSYKNTWKSNKGQVRAKFPSLLAFVKRSINDEELEIKAALSLVSKHTKLELTNLLRFAERSSKDQTNTLLSTAHSMKGQESDTIIILSDLNEAVTKAIKTLKFLGDEDESSEAEYQREELRLYYVACSRARFRLVNAKLLPVVKNN
jgi:hypothetical protein